MVPKLIQDVLPVSRNLHYKSGTISNQKDKFYSAIKIYIFSGRRNPISFYMSKSISEAMKKTLHLNERSNFKYGKEKCEKMELFKSRTRTLEMK